MLCKTTVLEIKNPASVESLFIDNVAGQKLERSTMLLKRNTMSDFSGKFNNFDHIY